jgi:hypothetical protein
MGFSRFGHKAMHTAKLGAKSIHTVSKFGSKYAVPAASLASIGLMATAPEVAIPLATAASVAKPILSNIQKITK